jgi:hypothetical protein
MVHHSDIILNHFDILSSKWFTIFNKFESQNHIVDIKKFIKVDWLNLTYK